MRRTKRVNGQQTHQGGSTDEANISGFVVPRVPLPVLGQVKYQFKDSPRPEADVMIVSYALQTSGSGMWLVGRLFNRGLKPAHNVRIRPNLTGKYGTRPPASTLYLTTSDIPPTSFADFEGRVALYSDLEISAQPTVEWDP